MACHGLSISAFCFIIIFMTGLVRFMILARRPSRGKRSCLLSGGIVHTELTAGMSFTAGRWPIDASLPSLLFVHGAGGSSSYWSNHLAGLAGIANTIAVDLPGRGGSQGTGCVNIEDYAHAVKGLLAAFRLPQVVPVGFSMGGAVALQLLLDAPGDFAGAVLVSTGARLRVLPAIFELITNDFATFLDQLGRTLISPASDPSLLSDVIEDTAHCDPRVILADFTACDSFDVRARLGEIDVPVLVLSAADDLLTPQRYGAYLEDNIRDAQRVHIADAGHCLSIEKAADFDAAVRKFLRQLDHQA